MDANKLKEILEQHKLWLADFKTGKRAVLRSANLSGCDLSYADLRGCDLSFADLRGCDLSYADLRDCDLGYANLRGCDLSYADLRDCDLSYADLRGCDLRYADLRGCDLSYAKLSYADLSYADLNGDNLRGCDLSYAKLSGIKFLAVTPDPQLAAKIAERVVAQEGSLCMRSWHTCETVHCLAGWATTLHPEGKDLEDQIGTNAAAALIFQASCGEVPDFFSEKETAIAWVKSKAYQQGQE